MFLLVTGYRWGRAGISLEIETRLSALGWGTSGLSWGRAGISLEIETDSTTAPFGRAMIVGAEQASRWRLKQDTRIGAAFLEQGWGRAGISLEIETGNVAMQDYLLRRWGRAGISLEIETDKITAPRGRAMIVGAEQASRWRLKPLTACGERCSLSGWGRAGISLEIETNSGNTTVLSIFFVGAEQASRWRLKLTPRTPPKKAEAQLGQSRHLAGD